jgi:hypothetical protein
MLKPKAKFVMGPLEGDVSRPETIMFRLFAAGMELADFTEKMSCVSHVVRLATQNQSHVYISPLYDTQEAYAYIAEQLRVESEKVELGPVWGEVTEEKDGG